MMARSFAFTMGPTSSNTIRDPPHAIQLCFRRSASSSFALVIRSRQRENRLQNRNFGTVITFDWSFHTAAQSSTAMPMVSKPGSTNRMSFESFMKLSSVWLTRLSGTSLRAMMRLPNSVWSGSSALTTSSAYSRMPFYASHADSGWTVYTDNSK